MKKFFAAFLLLFFFSEIAVAADLSHKKSVLRQLFVEEILFANKNCAHSRECFRSELRDYFVARIKTKRDAKKECADLVSKKRIEDCHADALLNASKNFIDFGAGLSKTRSKIYYDLTPISQVREPLFGKKVFDAATFEANEFFAWDKNNLYFRERSAVLLVPVFEDKLVINFYKEIFSVGEMRAIGADFLVNSEGLYSISDLKKCDGSFDAETLEIEGNILKDKNGEWDFERDISGVNCPVKR